MKGNKIYKYFYNDILIGEYDPKHHFIKSITLDDWKDMRFLKDISNIDPDLFNDVIKDSKKKYIISRTVVVDNSDENSHSEYILMSFNHLKIKPDFLIIINRNSKNGNITCNFLKNPNIEIKDGYTKEDNDFENRNLFSKLKIGDEFRVIKNGLTFSKITPRKIMPHEIKMITKDIQINTSDYLVVAECENGPDILLARKGSDTIEYAVYHDPYEAVKVRNGSNVFTENIIDLSVLFETAINERRVYRMKPDETTKEYNERVARIRYNINKYYENKNKNKPQPQESQNTKKVYSIKPGNPENKEYTVEENDDPRTWGNYKK